MDDVQLNSVKLKEEHEDEVGFEKTLAYLLQLNQCQLRCHSRIFNISYSFKELGLELM